MTTYEGDFSNWEDVQKRFRIDCPEPEQVLFAAYDLLLYDGYAFVAYRNADKFYTVSASHCSCHDLEGQWEPEEYTQEQFFALIERNLQRLERGISYRPENKFETWETIKRNLNTGEDQ
jgi:hypothetical protein